MSPDLVRVASVQNQGLLAGARDAADRNHQGSDHVFFHVLPHYHEKRMAEFAGGLVNQGNAFRFQRHQHVEFFQQPRRPESIH
jgi:hypothetical protein